MQTHCPTVLAPAVVLLSPVRAVAGKSADGSTYDWAIVSGGPPSTSGKDGCVVGPLNPGPQDVNNSGTLRASKVCTSCATACWPVMIVSVCNEEYQPLLALPADRAVGHCPAGLVVQ